MPGGSDYFRGYARDVGVNPPIGGATNVQDALTAGSAPAGVSIVRAFPFAYDTPGILTGAPLYTPTVGDLLLDAWIEIDTAWDGTTPLGDLGQFVDNNFGFYGNYILPINMAQASPSNYGTGTVQLTPTLAVTSEIILVTNNVETSPQDGSMNPLGLTLAANGSIVGAGNNAVPAKFTTADPIKVCVSQDGTNTGANPGSTQGAAVLYLATATPA